MYSQQEFKCTFSIAVYKEHDKKVKSTIKGSILLHYKRLKAHSEQRNRQSLQ